jgi:hypothetical protein
LAREISLEPNGQADAGEDQRAGRDEGQHRPEILESAHRELPVLRIPLRPRRYDDGEVSNFALMTISSPLPLHR